MKPHHHPLPETLISFASGTLPSSIASVVACHLSMCGECAQHARGLEMWAGLMLEQLTPSDADHAVAERVAEHIGVGEMQRAEDGARAFRYGDTSLPEPLEQYLDGRDIEWTATATGAEVHDIALPGDHEQMKLLRLSPGQLLLDHVRIAGAGLGLVIDGALRDHTGDYERGDVLEWTDDCAPRPIVSGDRAAICLIASEDQPKEAVAPQKPGAHRALPKSLRQWRTIELALAASLSLIVGIGFGWLLGDESGDEWRVARDFIRVQSNRLIAQGTLAEMLETVPSSSQTSADLVKADDVRLGVRMTFQDQTGRYCRQYWIALPMPAYHTGVACRSDGQWIAQIQALVPPPADTNGQVVPAGSNLVLDAVVASLIQGDPLGSDAEAGLLSGGWKD